MTSPPSILPGIVAGPSRRFDLAQGNVTIGRDEGSTILLAHPQVSRCHAVVTRDGGATTIVDLHSSNGTFVNDAPVTEPHPLQSGDMIRISDYVFVYHDGLLELFSEVGNARLDAVRLIRIVPPGTVILDNVSISIRPRELVAIVGTSGAGKSTLVNALSGFRPADSGVVLLNGVDFYRNLDSLRETLGFVPQDDIIHAELTVERALYYAACLRLPEDTLRHEMEERVEQVLADLQLLERRHLPITRLSGGQRKRVSIGVELLTRPRLFFLDEPTSGLDPGLETEMMRTFRSLANQGHTLLVITHATHNIHMCDQVVYLARGGRLAWFGPPAGALLHFGVADFPATYARCESLPAEEWEARYRESPTCKSMVEERLREIPPALMPTPTLVFRGGKPDYLGAASKRREPRLTRWLRDEAFHRPVRRIGMLRQFFILAQRYGEIIVRDRRNLILLLLQAPVIAALLAAAFEPDVFDLVQGNYLMAKTLLFLMVCCCIWFGTSNAAREITKESAIWRRERATTLKIPPYVFSKIAVLFVLCAVQSASMVAVIATRIEFPDLGPVMLQKLFLVLLLASVGGLAMGLLLSAIVSNPDKAQSMVPVLLIPQLVLAGALIPLQGLARELGFLMVSKWAFEMLGQAMRLQELPFVDAPGVEMSPEYAFQISFAGHFWVLAGFIGALVALTCLVMRTKDRVE